MENTEKPKRSRGGQPKPKEQHLVQKSVRMLGSQWAKMERNGGPEWLREVVDAAPDQPLQRAASGAKSG